MDEQTEILRGILLEMKGLNARATTTNERLGELKGELTSEVGSLRDERILQARLVVDHVMKLLCS